MLKKVKKIPLKVIRNKSGNIIKYLDKKNLFFLKFGEVYFSKIKKNYTKGWNLHKKTTCMITVPFGSVNFVLKDFKMSKSKRINLNDNYPSLLIIPPNIWFKFSTKKNYSLIVNLIDKIHDDRETRKLPLNE